MLSPNSCTFKVRNDDFSAQVSCNEDPKFWFRLETVGNQDHITDFFLGVFDPALAGDLLAMCYAKIGRTPQAQLVFDDILSSRPSSPDLIDKARVNLEGYTKELLAHYGRSVRASRIVPSRNKLHLVLDG